MKICKKIMIILMMCSIIISNITLDVIAQKEDVITEPQSLMEVEKPEARMYDREGNEIVQGIPESVVEPVKELVGLENTQRARTVTPPEVEAAALELRAGMIERQSEIVINVNAGTSWNKDELVDMVLNKALENTENGYEGDYLQWDIKSSTTRVFVNNDDYELKFSFEYYTSYEQEQEIEEAVAEIIASLGITEETSDFDKIKKVYEWITFNVEYDWDNVLGEAGIEHSAYAAVIDRIAVCQGYSKLLYRMLKEVDIENRIVIGETGVEGILHMWNIVELNGKYYFCDSTSENAGHYDFFLKGRYDFPGYSCYEEYYEAFDIAEMGYPVSHEDSVTKDGFVYQIVADEVLLKGYIGENVNVVVPAEIEGYAVKEIAMYAFYGNHTIETL